MYQTSGVYAVDAVNPETGRAVRDAYSYDYVTVETYGKFAIEYVDCYEALGFELVKDERTLSLKTALTFKRDRKIKNKEHLEKLRLKLDGALKEIDGLELNKNTLPMTAAIGLGTVGALTFGGGLCLCLLSGAIGAIIGGVALGIAGLGIAALGYLAHKKLYAKKSAEMNVLIDKKRDEISSLCEEAQRRLS